jgi:hypothetical protein
MMHLHRIVLLGSLVLLTSANAVTPAAFLTVASTADHAASGWRCIPGDNMERRDHRERLRAPEPGIEAMSSGVRS